MVSYWARKRLFDYPYVMHEDWVFSKHQFAYEYIKPEHSTTGVEFWRIVVRERRAWFGATEWYHVDDFHTFEACCRNIRGIIEDYRAGKWAKFIRDTDEAKKEQESQILYKKYCGFDIRRRMI